MHYIVARANGSKALYPKTFSLPYGMENAWSEAGVSSTARH
jgi:hypothetical protein